HMFQRATFRHGLLALCLLLLPTLWAMAQTEAGGTIGGEAETTYENYYKNAPAQPADGSSVSTLLVYAVAIAGLVSLLLFIAIGHLSRLTSYRPFAFLKSNPINARLFVLFFVCAVVALVLEHNAYARYALIGSASSAHGVSLDNMMVVTIIITGIVFVITQTLLFLFAYLYHGRPGRQASYYHDNHKLELWWTVIPATVLAVMVLFGVQAWNEIHTKPSADALQLELVAEQFQWNVRYAGKDNSLGGSDYRLIGSNGGLNTLGVKWQEPQSHDDIVGGVDDSGAKVLYLPKGRPVMVNIRAKDVLHGVYMPHFRVQMYAVPGMPTHFYFTPTVTTEEKRAQTGNPNFEYELACSQLCGSAHYNMRVVIRVVEEEAFKTWLAEQPKAYDAIKAAEAPKETPAPAAPDSLTQTASLR
ncbi:MAG: cytochrome c oxidase subunit II, partial [Bacteroidia bacterium]|nr:cytochrome c oxidase subunit II [Bacteroidia bacterium]